MTTRDAFSTAASLVRMAFEVAGARAPSVLARYGMLTYLNRTSKGRPIRDLPVPGSVSAVPAVETPGGGMPIDADIVVPVYNDFEGVSALLPVLREEAASFSNIILVHDCSPDPRLGPLLSDFEQAVPNAIVLENDQNLGFLRTCNRGLEASKYDAVILNTDIELPRGALARLIAALRSDARIASATPFSSNAYGAGFPDLNYENQRPFGATTEQIDTAFQAIGPFAPIDIPRGVGFCMAMSRQAMTEIGVFDESFGMGYGEESDFCLRAEKAGFRNVLAPNTYVHHKAGQSFGTSAQTKAREGLLRLLARHPHYPAMMGNYLAAGTARAVGFLALAALAKAVIAPASTAPAHSLRTGPDETDLALSFADETYRFAAADAQTAAKLRDLAGL